MWISFIYSRHPQPKASKTDTLDLCQSKPFLAMRQGGILLYIIEFIAYFEMFSFYLEIVNRMRQVSITISGFTHSIKYPCGRGDIKFI